MKAWNTICKTASYIHVTIHKTPSISCILAYLCNIRRTPDLRPYSKSIYSWDLASPRASRNFCTCWVPGSYKRTTNANRSSVNICLVAGPHPLSDTTSGKPKGFRNFYEPCVGINWPSSRTAEVKSWCYWWDLTLETYPHYWHDKKVVILTHWTWTSQLLHDMTEKSGVLHWQFMQLWHIMFTFCIPESPTQWWRDLFRCRTDLLNFSMGFNIIAPYMEFYTWIDILLNVLVISMLLVSENLFLINVMGHGNS